MKRIVIWYSPTNGGDGSVGMNWFLTQEEAEKDQEEMDDGWGEDCSGSVETFEGSNIHNSALRLRDSRNKSKI